MWCWLIICICKGVRCAKAVEWIPCQGLETGKYRHTGEEYPQDGYRWPATRQRQTTFDAYHSEHWKCGETCAQSGGQAKNTPLDPRDLAWNLRPPLNRAHDYSPLSPAQMLQTMSPVWHAANSCWRSLTILHAGDRFHTDEKVFNVESPFNSQNDRVYTRQSEPRSDSSNPSVCYTHTLNIQQINYGVGGRVRNGCDRTDIHRPGLEWRSTGNITEILCCCLSRCFLQSNMSQVTCLCSNKTALPHIAPVTPSSCYSVRRLTSSVLISGHPTVQTWTRSTTRSGTSRRNVRRNVVWTMSMNWSSVLLTSGMVCSRTSLTRLSTNGGSDWKLVLCACTGRHFEHSLWLSDADLEWKNLHVLCLCLFAKQDAACKLNGATKFANLLVLWFPRQL